MVSDIHRNMLKSQEGANDQRQSVSAICTPFRYRMDRRLPLPGLKPGRQSWPLTDPVSYTPM